MFAPFNWQQRQQELDAKLLDDVLAVMTAFDTDNTGLLDADEARRLEQRYQQLFTSPIRRLMMNPVERKAFAVLRDRFDTKHDGNVDTVELQRLLRKIQSDKERSARYAAYCSVGVGLVRYAAYVSDIGEAFRPVVHRYLVRSAYLVSWGYVVGDVAWEGKKDYDKGVRGNTLYQHVTKRATFQAIASMALPAFTIHSVVHFMQHHVFARCSPRVKVIGPTASGIAVIPFLPHMYDHPVERATDFIFDRVWPVEGQSSRH